MWLLNQGKDAVTGPIYDIPSLYLQHQFRNYPGLQASPARYPVYGQATAAAVWAARRARGSEGWAAAVHECTNGRA
jgi:hypothetical protein